MCDNTPISFDTILANAKVHLLKVEQPKVITISPRPTIIVHAGAEHTPVDQRTKDLEIIKLAATSTYQLLRNNLPALQAVERTIRYLETFHRQQCEQQNDDIQLEADAAILGENNLKAGCVGAVQRCRHPISLAKLVMQRTDHTLIVEEGADRLAEDLSDSDEMIDASDRASSSNPLLERRAEEEAGLGDVVAATDNQERSTLKSKTFGAVAYDGQSQLSCGTTVFRTENFGRLSATGSVIGCGIFGDETGCACVSGEDETIYAYAPARSIVERLGEKSALRKTIDELMEKSGKENFGGIVVDAAGVPRVYSRARSFPWAFCVEDRLFYSCLQGESFCEKLQVPEDQLDCFCEESNEGQ